MFFENGESYKENVFQGRYSCFRQIERFKTLQYWGFHWNSLFDVIFILQWVSAIILLAFVLWKWWILQGIQFQGWKNVLFIVNEGFIFMLSTDWIIETFESFCFTTQFSIHLAVNLTRNTFFRILKRNNRCNFDSFRNMQNYSCQM